jgi:hypothetical protein
MRLTYLIAVALAGEPTPPVMFRGLTVRRHSYRWSMAQSRLSSSSFHNSPMGQAEQGNEFLVHHSVVGVSAKW